MESLSSVRRLFTDFFEKKGHSHLPSAPLVPKNDPTLMFVAAGMVPFKDYFTGQEAPPHARIVTSQKCVRAGGKHNDLDNVGYTARHHTFFEMLGNFSFGDYFKEQAISWAWELVNGVLNLPKDRLLVTVYAEDTESAALWKKIAGFSDHRIIPIATDDNFWRMGDTGPCGPCTEIFYDHGDHIPGGPPGSVDEDGDRFVEIWNMVFMQYNQTSEGLVPLPRPCVDTGSGLERLTAVLQGVHSNYDIDLFKTLIQASQDLVGENRDSPSLASHRVIADHLRAISFLLADGVTPSNEGRGYVLRRIMRRAMRHAYKLGTQDPMMHRLVPALIQAMGDAYPELARGQSYLQETILSEETRFRETLGRGLKLLEDEVQGLKPQGTLGGDVAFKLYDTYGFPLDLTQDILRADGFHVDVKGFEDAMANQKETARQHWVGSGDKASESLWKTLKSEHGPTIFLGYDHLSSPAKVVYMASDKEPLNALAKGQEAWVLFDQTPFYAESGGQMGDRGTLLTSAGFSGKIKDTQKAGDGYHIHLVQAEKGTLGLGDTVQVIVDASHRQGLKIHHSATHLLHSALRSVLGSHVVQKGSLVAADRLRFDFSHSHALDSETVTRVEKWVNARIRMNTPAITRVQHPEDAMASGALGLFGEKYGQEVRVVSFKQNDDVEPESIELCGGTHVDRTGEIGFFKITGQSSVAAGIRRLDAVAGHASEAYVRALYETVTDMASLLKVAPDAIMSKAQRLVDEKKSLEKELKDLRLKGSAVKDTFIQEKIHHVVFVHGIDPTVTEPKDLKPLAERLLSQNQGAGLVAVGCESDGKISLVVTLGEGLSRDLSAVNLIQKAVLALGGKGGGGRPTMAQGGGTNPQAWGTAMETIRWEIQKIGTE